jgi:hypothetical protein
MSWKSDYKVNLGIKPNKKREIECIAAVNTGPNKSLSSPLQNLGACHVLVVSIALAYAASYEILFK